MRTPELPARFARRILVLAAMASALGACVRVRVPPLPTGDLPAHWQHAEADPALGAAPDLTGWWKRFDDPQLDALVTRALRDNLDVRQAALKLRAARALAEASNAAFRPQAGFRTLEQPNPEGTRSYFQAGFDASWEFGMFGRRDASGHVAAADVGVAEAGLQQARVSLVAEVVHQYLELRAAQRSEVLLAEAARAAARKRQLVAVQRRLQLASELQLEQAGVAAGQAQARMADPRAQAARHAQALALLLGRSEPDRDWLAPAPLPTLAAGNFDAVPADLLRTRPEIRQAQARVLQAAGALGIAKADLYPRLALGSSLTFAAPVSGQTRLGPVNSTFGIGPLIDIPLFDWGRRRAVRDARDAQLQAALLAYRQAVLQGAAEVETDLAALHATAQRVRHASAAAAAAQRALALREKLRSLQQADDLQVADARQASAAAELDREHARLAQALAYVALYKALGGAPLADTADTGGAGEAGP